MIRVAPSGRRRGVPVAQAVTLPAPVGGLNARDAVANMPATDALILDNYFPTATSVEVRKGYTSWATFTGQCETVIDYAGLTSTSVFVAVVNGSTRTIFDATSGGALSTAVVGGTVPTVQALTSTRFDHVTFGTTGGQFLLACNGADAPLEYNGSAWSTTATTGSGLTVSNLFTVQVYAQRVWYAEKNTFNVWYLDVATKSGTLTKLNLGSLFKLGGSINSIVTVTDSTDSLDDYIGFVSTEGEVVAFSGANPASATDWFRVAHFRVGRPVCTGNRAWTKVGADALLICADGVVSLRRAIATDRAENASSISDKIQPLVNTDVLANGARYGWALVLHPSGQKLILNVPTRENATARQYVMNTETRAWCRFLGWDAFAWTVTKDTLWWGGDGKLVKADTGHADGSASITAQAKQAFNYLGARSRKKLVTLMRPILSLDGPLQFGVSIDTDYEDGPAPDLYPISGSADDPWGGLWSVPWSQATSVYREWLTVYGQGSAIAPRVRTVSEDTSVSWSATDLTYEPGSIGP